MSAFRNRTLAAASFAMALNMTASEDVNTVNPEDFYGPNVK